MYFRLPILSIFLLFTSGCSSISYYTHLMSGHFALMSGEKPIEEVLAQQETSAELKAKLQQVLVMRQFAVAELGLPDNGSYKKFVKLDRKYPVWNVVATKPYSITPRQWCFLVVGCISYRGYFNEAAAQAKAAELQGQGYDVQVSGASAYSTLGWFNDPLVSSMLYRDDVHLAGVLFHELAHQQVYIENDSAFNEAFATAVELEGVRRWLLKLNDPAANQRYRIYKERQKDFNQLLRGTREKLKQFYAAEKEPQKLAEGKRRLFAELQQEYLVLKKRWDGYDGYDKWMAQGLNNAHLALTATYHELVPAFEALLQRLDYDLPRFYAEVTRIGKLEKAERQAALADVQITKVE
ncbi:MAG: aminopeptidase [Gammaproteobacteria bacterium]|nr:aminopeptidase [Gammaproteobacteria bacterium]MDH5653747.1 aminopeptidase [Gammaproteobacteria bacterium]